VSFKKVLYWFIFGVFYFANDLMIDYCGELLVRLPYLEYSYLVESIREGTRIQT